MNLKRRILYVDELVFTKATVPRLEYSARYTNQTVDEKDYYHRYYACVAAISADRGVDHYMIFETAVTSDLFITFLHSVKARNANREVYIFFDNLPAHKTDEVHETMQQLQQVPVFNVPYRY